MEIVAARERERSVRCSPVCLAKPREKISGRLLVCEKEKNGEEGSCGSVFWLRRRGCRSWPVDRERLRVQGKKWPREGNGQELRGKGRFSSLVGGGSVFWFSFGSPGGVNGSFLVSESGGYKEKGF